jgi:paraquat-inducible protein B
MIVFVILFSKVNFFRSTTDFALYFDSSLNGLGVGSSVKFKGVSVGVVKKISIFYDEEKDLAVTPVIIEIDNAMFDTIGSKSKNEDNTEFYKKQIKQGLAAKLTFESIVTGKLFIELDYYGAKKIRTFSVNNTQYSQIPTTSSGIDEFLVGTEQIIKKISKIDFIGISDKISSILSMVDHSLTNTDLKSMVTSITIAANSINDIFKLPDLKHALKRFDKTLHAIEIFVSALKSKINPVSDNIQSMLETCKIALEKFGNMSESIDYTVSGEMESKYGLDDAIQEITRAAKSFRALVDYLERNPNAILSGKSSKKK